MSVGERFAQIQEIRNRFSAPRKAVADELSAAREEHSDALTRMKSLSLLGEDGGARKAYPAVQKAAARVEELETQLKFFDSGDALVFYLTGSEEGEEIRKLCAELEAEGLAEIRAANIVLDETTARVEQLIEELRTSLGQMGEAARKSACLAEKLFQHRRLLSTHLREKLVSLKWTLWTRSADWPPKTFLMTGDDFRRSFGLPPCWAFLNHHDYRPEPWHPSSSIE